MTEKSLNISVGGKYTLIKKIGEGGFGHVYVATCDSTNERVAVKLVSDSKSYVVIGDPG